MDKKWQYLLRHNKALQFLSKYLIILIREINEKEILGDILKANLGYDEILIEESSKDIIDINAIKKNKNQKKSSKNTKLKRGQSLFGSSNEIRKVELIYFCLLKFKGLIRYMNFQGLKHNDIKKIAYFIKHISFKRGEYIFRQGDKSDALYGVITGKVIIRFIKTIDVYKKLSYENIFDENLEPVNNVTIDYFMSDCEEEDSESEENENDDYVIIENKKKLTYKGKKKTISILDEPDESESERKLREKINELRFKKVANETEDQIDRDIDKKVIWERKRKIDFSIQFKKNTNNNTIQYKKKKLKNKKKEKKYVKSFKQSQTPKDKIEGEVLFNFIKDFENDNFQLTNGMCFGEWGLVYSIPRTTSIYCIEDCDLFYLEKDYFNRILASKFAQSDSNKINFLIKTFPIFKTDIKVGHILTKIVPLFFENETIVYTPFDKAENLYVVYQGECTLVLIENAISKDDYFIKKTNYKIISRLSEGGIAGFESCSEKLTNYNNALLISKEYTTLLKVNIKVISEMYKDFKKSVYPLYEKQKKIYEKIKKEGEKVKYIFNSKRFDDNKKNIEKIVLNAINKKKERHFSNDVKVKSFILDKNEIVKLKNKDDFWENNNVNFIKNGKSKKIKCKFDKFQNCSNIKIPKIPKINLEMVQNNIKYKLRNVLSPKQYLTDRNKSNEKSKRPISSLRENLSTEFNTIIFSKIKKNKEENEFFNLTNIKKSHHRNINSDLSNYFTPKINNIGIEKGKNISPILSEKKLEFYNSGKFNLPFLSEVI